MTAHAQAILPLHFEPSFAAEDFVVSDCNKDAHAWVTRWPDWTGFCLHLYGPAACGKTHLAAIWKQQARAVTMDASALPGHNWQATPGQAYLIELGEAIEEEAALLHFFNQVKEQGGWLLLTSRKPFSRFDIALRDLSSRLTAAPAVPLLPPDDAALRHVLLKLFADRQLRVPEDVVHYLLARMERSFEKAVELVAALDRLSLEERHRITIPLVTRCLMPLDWSLF